MARTRCRAAAVLLQAAAALLAALPARGLSPEEVQTNALLSLPAACSNWDAATAGLPGAAWQNGTQPCGSGGANGTEQQWKGLVCNNEGNVTEVQLAGLGLAGALPPGLADLNVLEMLNLSGNAFEGPLPVEWLSPMTFISLLTADLSSNEITGTISKELVLLSRQDILLGGNRLSGQLPQTLSNPDLERLDLSFNQFTGLLPPAWGDKTALPNLARLGLQGNLLRGPVPDPAWTAVGFKSPCVFVARPGNEGNNDEPGLCGQVLGLNPRLFDEGFVIDPSREVVIDKPQTGSLSNTSTLILSQPNLFLPGTFVTITNTLGTCMLPCASLSGTGLNSLPDSATVQTNMYDLTWQYNVSAGDLLLLNPDGAAAKPGDSLRLPCYPPGGQGQAPNYFGGSVAYLQFTGGNQQEGLAGLEGAQAASGVNDHIPNQNDFDTPYVGSLYVTPEGDLELSYPLYLFVDLEASFGVTAVVITSGGGMTNASIYIGSNSSSVQANTLVASGLDIPPRSTVAVPVAGARGRYVVVWTGMANEGNMSVSDLQVYAAETNAAMNKPVAVTSSGDGSNLEALSDSSASTCAMVQGDPRLGDGAPGGAAVVSVDLGYTATVGAITLLAGASVAPNTFARALVKSSAQQDLQNATVCGDTGLQLQPGQPAVVACNVTGRYVVISVPLTSANGSVELCDIQVGLTTAPLQTGTDTGANGGSTTSGGGSTLSGGAIAGIVVGAVAGVAVLAAAGLYVSRHRSGAAGAAGKAAAAKDNGLDAVAVQAPPGDGLPPTDPAWGSGTAAAGPGGAAGHAAAAVAAGGAATAAAGAAAAAGAGAVAISYVDATSRSGGSSGLSYGSPASASLANTPDIISANASGGSSSTLQEATDLSKLPPGFNDVASSDFTLIRAIGDGSFSQVYLGKYCETTVAIKMLTQPNVPSATASMQQRTALANLQKEAGLMAKLRHPNVCQYLGACRDPPCLIMEYCSKKSLDQLLSAGLANPKGPVAKQLTWGRLLNMALDAAKGMLYLHSRSPPIAHRDLKSANLLVDGQWHVKVCDFNLSRAQDTSSQQASTLFITNPRWLAPEVLSGHPGQLPADVWAFGSVLWEMCTWRLPYEGWNAFQIITHVQSHVHANGSSSGLVIPAPQALPAGLFPSYRDLCDLMQACWARDPAQRPTFAEIVQRLRSMLAVELRMQQQQREGSLHTHARLPEAGISSAASTDRTSAPARISAEQAASAAAREQADAQPPAADTPFAATEDAGGGGLGLQPGAVRQPSRSLPDTPFAALASCAPEPSSALASPPQEPEEGGGSSSKSRKASS